MPTTYQVDAARSLVRVVMSGELTFDELLEARRQQGGNLALLSCSAVLVDLSDVTAMPISADEIRRLSGTRRELPFIRGSTRTAVVAPTPLTYGLSRMYEMTRRDDCPFAVFASMDEALDWLEQPEPSDEALPCYS